MAKRIKIEADVLDELRAQFEDELKNLKLANGKFSFQRNFADVDAKATLTFTPVAYRKMTTLVDEFDKEVAWHGFAYRDGDDYLVTDIEVYPQEVTGATVTTDQAKYQTWLMNHDDDEFSAIKLQGHSHVNMSTTPSTTDSRFYESILSQLKDDMFYIFLIWNKRNERTIIIYDLKKNTFFENKDISVAVLDDGSGINEFVENAKKMVQTEKPKPMCYGGYGGIKGQMSYLPSGSKKKKQSTSKVNYANDWDDDNFYRYGHGGRYYGAY